MPATPERDEDSGLIDLDALMRKARESGPSLPAPDQSGERLVVRPASEAKTAAPAPAPAPAPAIVAAPSPHPPPQKRRGLLPVAGAITLVAALATGAFFFGVRTSSKPSPPLEPVTRPTVSLPRPPPTAEEPRAFTAGDLPSAPASSAAASSAVVPSASVRVRPVPAGAAVHVSDVVAESVPGATGDLGRAMHDAVGARDEARPESNAGASSGARQLRPSPGAVVGAINAVLPDARACLQPDDPVRSGTLVFRSDGTVARVDLRGERPQDDCIRTAMGRARIEPFVEDTFTTRVTVRP